MVGDGTQLRTSEAAAILNVSPSTVINYLRNGLLRATRTAGRHRRIYSDSVAELSRALAIANDEERDRALEELRRRNRGEDQSDT